MLLKCVPHYQHMHIVDRVYGEHYVDEPLMRELILSRPVQRLKGLEQYGFPRRLYPVEGYSRYEHSVGVMLFLRSLQASLTQQAAGLLHDVSHLAFSHVTDGIFGSADGRNAQDERHMGFVLSSELPSILSRHNLDAVKVADLEAHPLLDREIPDLCADRVDYSLREFSFHMGTDRIREMLSSMTVHENRIIFMEKEPAAAFAVNYLACHVEKLASPEKTVRQHILSGVVKRALDIGVLTFNDLLSGDDEQALGIIARSSDPCIKAGLRTLCGPLLMVEDDKAPQLTLRRRLRYVDPEVAHLGRPFRLSEIDATFREMVRAHKALHEKPLSVSLLHRLGRH